LKVLERESIRGRPTISAEQESLNRLALRIAPMLPRNPRETKSFWSQLAVVKSALRKIDILSAAEKKRPLQLRSGPFYEEEIEEKLNRLSPAQK
jgi:hypothetical protein